MTDPVVPDLNIDEILRLATSRPDGGLLVSNTIPALVAEVKRLRIALATAEAERDGLDAELERAEDQANAHAQDAIVAEREVERLRAALSVLDDTKETNDE